MSTIKYADTIRVVITYELEFLSGEQYRDYTVSGYMIEEIMGLYDKAMSDDSKIRTVLMNGGVNNILRKTQNVSKCNTTGTTVPSECKTILNSAIEHIGILLDSMHDDGVDQIVYLGYYHLTKSRAKLSPAIDYLVDNTIDICNNSQVECYFVDTRDIFDSHPEWVNFDNIHPSDAGSKVMAEMIWDVMTANNIEQNIK